MLEDGANIRVLQELLGHSDGKTPQIYRQVLRKDLDRLPNPLDRLGSKVAGGGKAEEICTAK